MLFEFKQSQLPSDDKLNVVQLQIELHNANMLIAELKQQLKVSRAKLKSQRAMKAIVETSLLEY